MDVRSEVRDFLTSRRGRITPEDAGLKVFGPRRVPGLRREEVAMLAGLSVDYYNRLERGNLGGASDSVLAALADALRLDDAERAHLHDLARASQPTTRSRRRSATPTIRPSVQWMLDSMTASAAFAENGRLDALGANRLGRALYPAVFGEGSHSGNWARFIFFNPEARSFYADWDARPERAWRYCDRRRVGALMTETSPTSSVSSPRKARSSAASGPRTTCACTPRASSASITRSWASSSSALTGSRSRRILA